jgi:hypothetical protein
MERAGFLRAIAILGACEYNDVAAVFRI